MKLTPEQITERNRVYREKWLAKPGNKEKADEARKKCQQEKGKEYKKRHKEKMINLHGKEYTDKISKQNSDAGKRFRALKGDEENLKKRDKYHNDEDFKNKIIERSKNYYLENKDTEQYQIYQKNKRYKDRFKKHKITEDIYLKILDSQDGKCGICRKDKTTDGHTWHIDHDHKTNEIRGILCRECNLGLGHFEDNEEFLSEAIDYLKRQNKDLK